MRNLTLIKISFIIEEEMSLANILIQTKLNQKEIDYVFGNEFFMNMKLIVILSFENEDF